MAFKTKKTIILYLTIFILLSQIVTFSIGSNLEKTNISVNEELESHLIEGVPYIYQEEGIYCSPATIEMIFEYYGFNTSQTEILYYLGGGYSLGYKFHLSKILSHQIKPPYAFSIWPGWAITQGTDDKKFLANIFGCNAEKMMPERIISHQKTWTDYWKTVKGYINRDIPVMTSVDPGSWPLYMEIKNISRIPIFNKGGHCILIVGYNENNNSLCFNDAYAGYKGFSEKGTYQWVSISDFKRSLRRSSGSTQKYNCYEIITIEKVTEPLSQKEAFESAHIRNIERLKGNVSQYDSDHIIENFQSFGIKALEELKKDFQLEILLNRILFYKVLNKISGGWLPFEQISYYYGTEAEVKQRVSNYIMNITTNLSLSNSYVREAELLMNESYLWKNLSSSILQLDGIIKENNFIKARVLSKDILEVIVQTIDEIISIEEAIIVGPGEE